MGTLPFPGAAVPVKRVSLPHLEDALLTQKKPRLPRFVLNAEHDGLLAIAVCAIFGFAHGSPCGCPPSDRRIARRQKVLPDVAWDSNTSSWPPTAFIKERS